MERGDEQRLERGLIRQTLVFFQAADLRFTVANGDGKFQLREPFPPPQIFEQIAKAGEGVGREGLVGLAWLGYAVTAEGKPS